MTGECEQQLVAVHQGGRSRPLDNGLGVSALPLALADVHADHGHEVSETLGLQDLQAQQEIERLSIDDVSPPGVSRRITIAATWSRLARCSSPTR